MNEEMRMLGPEHWTIADLDRPTADCELPEPVRDEIDCVQTCPHCNVAFQMCQIIDASPEGYRETWVDYAQHRQMVVSWETEERRHYGNEEIY